MTRLKQLSHAIGVHPSLMRATLVCTMIMAYSSQSIAQDTWYQIEVVIAKRSQDIPSLEAFPALPEQLSKAKGLTLTQINPKTFNMDKLDNQEFISLPSESRILNAEVRTLESNSKYEVLLHQGWRQILDNNQRINWIKVAAGERFGDLTELEGRLGFSKGRFLHIHSDLHLNQVSNSTRVPSKQDVSQLLPLDQVITPAVKTRYSLNQRRKMRSNEMHYLDHPKLVLLVKIIPYTPAQTMLEDELETVTEVKPQASAANEPITIDLTLTGGAG